MTILSWPAAIRPVAMEWWQEANTTSFASPVNRSVQTLERPGARWACTLTLPRLKPPQARALFAFLTQLRGRAGRFRLHDFSHATPRGVATGSPLVKGAGQTGAALITDGWSAGVTGILLAGDWIGVNDELKLVVANANTNGSGEATLSLEPPLRASPADNAVITVASATAVMMLADDAQARFAAYMRGGVRGDFALQCVEAFT